MNDNGDTEEQRLIKMASDLLGASPPKENKESAAEGEQERRKIRISLSIELA